MTKQPVNIKLDYGFWQELEVAREDISRTRFFELLLDRTEAGHAKAWAAFDAARGFETTPLPEPQQPVQAAPQPVAPVPVDTPEPPAKPAAKRRTRKQAPAPEPEPEVTEDEAPPVAKKRPPRMPPVLTGRLKT